MTLEGILENIVSDVLFLAMVVVLGWLVFVLTRRARLLSFFGIGQSRRITIYLSNLRVKLGGSIGIDGRERSYQGVATAFAEMQVANRFRDLFNYLLPSLSESPGFLSKLLISDVRVQLLPSPLDSAQIERSTPFIALGSPAYNVASQFVETNLRSRGRFELVETDPTPEGQPGSYSSPNIEGMYPGATGTYVGDIGYAFPSGSPAPVESQTPWEPSENFVGSAFSRGGTSPRPQPRRKIAAIIVDGVAPMTDTTYGFVERVIDRDSKRPVYYAAGISELATAGAANYLISEWDKLRRKYGNDTGFLVMLSFDPRNFRRWAIIFER